MLFRSINFVKRLTVLRQTFPILRRNRFYTGEYNKELGIKDLTWLNTNGSEMQDKHWGDSNMKCFGMLMDGRTQPTGIKKLGGDATLLLVVNEHNDLVEFTLPESYGGDEWALLIDTNQEQKNVAGVFKSGRCYGVTGRSLLLFALHSAKA